MTRPTFEVADIVRVQGDRFLDRYRSSFSFQQLKAFRAILRCITGRICLSLLGSASPKKAEIGSNATSATSG
jgi:hypothetical protein